MEKLLSGSCVDRNMTRKNVRTDLSPMSALWHSVTGREAVT